MKRVCCGNRFCLLSIKTGILTLENKTRCTNRPGFLGFFSVNWSLERIKEGLGRRGSVERPKLKHTETLQHAELKRRKSHLRGPQFWEISGRGMSPTPKKKPPSAVLIWNLGSKNPVSPQEVSLYIITCRWFALQRNVNGKCLWPLWICCASLHTFDIISYSPLFGCMVIYYNHDIWNKEKCQIIPKVQSNHKKNTFSQTFKTVSKKRKDRHAVPRC